MVTTYILLIGGVLDLDQARSEADTIGQQAQPAVAQRKQGAQGGRGIFRQEWSTS
jgi:hypothetical protein